MLAGAAFGALSMLAAEISPGMSKVLSGCGTMSSGASAIQTGISLFSCGPVGWVAGVICLAVGAATMAFGLNEAVEGITGVNAIREATRISQEQYEMIYLGLNIASTVCTLAGQAIRGWKGCTCFIAGTLVLCMDEDGNECHKPIEDVKVGDMVWAYDEETGERAYKPVVRLFRNESKDWTGVTVNGLEIVSTPGHKYYLPETKKWVSAEDLKVGVKVLLSDGSYAIIEAVRAIHYDKPQTTYNFEVADFHTYYVGNGVLVHNRSQCSGKYQINEHDMQRHIDGTPGESQFLTWVDADEAVLKAADYADAHNLWKGTHGSQARVQVLNGPVGIIAENGQLTNYIKVTRTQSNYVHGWPARGK